MADRRHWCAASRTPGGRQRRLHCHLGGCRSRISPTMMNVRSCRISARSPSAKPKSSCGWTWVWLNPARSSRSGPRPCHVHFFGGDALERRVQGGGLARTVGPVTRTMPWGLLTSASQRCASCWAKPAHPGPSPPCRVEDAHHHLFAEGRGQRRQPHFDLVARGLRVLMRPSCGRRFSTTSMRPAA